MDKRILKRYEVTAYILLLTLAIILGFIGDKITQETIKSITINLASELLAVGILFFLINRIFLLDADEGLSSRILHEVSTVKILLQEEFEQEQKRQNQKVSVVLQNGSKNRLELPIKLRRAELTRAEILGRIGMIPMKEKGKRFSLGYLNTPDFLDDINKILENDSDDNPRLTVSCDENEYNQFELN